MRHRLALTVAACAAAFARAQLPTPEEDPALTLVRELSNRQFARAAARFDERMARALPASQLEAVWTGLVAQAGPFQGFGPVHDGGAGDTRLVIVTCRFARLSLDARVTFDNQGRGAGLFFAPHEAFSRAWQAPAYASPQAFAERDVTLGTGRWAVPGALTVPRRPGTMPAVVLVHGSGPNDRDETLGYDKPFKDLAWGLACRGIVVLRYDKRTKVHPEEFRELAATAQGFTVNEETIEDARFAVDLLRRQPEVDGRRVFVLGHSLGGMLAPRIAAGCAGVAGLIVLAGNTRPLEVVALDQVRYLAGLDPTGGEAGGREIAAAETTVREAQDPNLKPGMMVNFIGILMPASYFLDLRTYRPAEVAAALSIPMLIVRGERDYQVTDADFQGWTRALGGRAAVTFRLYPGLDHLFVAGSGRSTPGDALKPGHVAAEVVSDIAAWVQNRTEATK